MHWKRRLILLSSMCAWHLPGGVDAKGQGLPERNLEVPGLRVTLGGLKVTNEVIELRCLVRNDSKQDVWIYSGGPDDRSNRGGENAKLFMDTDGETLVVLRRMNVPRHTEIHGNQWSVRYSRLPTGQSKPEVLSVNLPVGVESSYFTQGFFQAASENVQVANRLAFEIGCFTSEYLNSRKHQRSPYSEIQFSESGEVVVVRDFSQGGHWYHERALRIVVDGVSIPYKQWVDFGMPKPEQTRLQLIENLFYGSIIDLQEYRYARRLFSVDNALFSDAAQTIAEVYLKGARGKPSSAEFAQSLEKVYSQADRARVLSELEARQAAVDREKQGRIASLLAAAKQCDNPAEGPKALTLLRVLLAIDPSHQEAFTLLREISALRQGRVITNSIGMQLAWIPAGDFTMGKTLKDPPQFEYLQHRVSITGCFYMGIHEVTQAQYEAIMGENPSSSKAQDKPVTNVSWHDAVEFCRKLSVKEGKAYRLPTEAEWEYACRAGTTTDYWWGDDPQGDSGAPNAFGLLGMHSGAAEWCHDWFSSAYYVESPRLDPQGPESPDKYGGRVVRGRQVRPHEDGRCSSYARISNRPEMPRFDIGFRVVLEQESD